MIRISGKYVSIIVINEEGNLTAFVLAIKARIVEKVKAPINKPIRPFSIPNLKINGKIIDSSRTQAKAQPADVPKIYSQSNDFLKYPTPIEVTIDTITEIRIKIKLAIYFALTTFFLPFGKEIAKALIYCIHHS